MAFNGRVGHLEGIESPWANGGGVVMTLEDVETMAKTGVGWIEVGSCLLEDRQDINPVGKINYISDELTGETFNSRKMPCRAFDVIEREIPEMVKIAHAHGKALVVNFASVAEDPTSELVELATRLYASGVDAALLNAGCPTVLERTQGRKETLSLKPSRFIKVASALAEASLPKPIWVRISPQEAYVRMKLICGVAEVVPIFSAVLAPNTWACPPPTHLSNNLVDGGWGKSGPAMADASARETIWARQALRNSKVDVIRSSGIVDARELKRSLDDDIVAGVGTTFFYESQNGWDEDTARLLTNLSNL